MVLHGIPLFQNSIKVVRIFPDDWVKIGLGKPADSPVGLLQYLECIRCSLGVRGMLCCIVQRVEIGQ